MDLIIKFFKEHLKSKMKLNYRPDIDGLRAISVFAVILYHADFLFYEKKFFKGGFIGVDIFFVISGYLITSLILKEIYLNNKFSLIDFYIRRIRRIIPLLFLIVLLCTPFAYYFLLPSSLVDFSKSALSTLVFSSNFYFHHSGLIYGGPDSSLKPLLHTWSLSVEEQFYIIFPIIIIFFFKYFKSNLLNFFIICFFLSLFSTQWIAYKFPLYNFYFINVRIWELLSGSIIAYLEIKSFKIKKNSLAIFLPYLGISSILLSIIFLNDELSLPSFYSLPAVIGTCLVIYFLNKENFIYKILTLKPLVFLGLISYSLYLWHYPLFAFNNYINFASNSNLIKIFIILISIILSILSFFFIEKIFRNKNIIDNKKLFYFILMLFVLIFFSNSSVLFNKTKIQKSLYDKVNIDNQVYSLEVEKKLNQIKFENNFNKIKNNKIKNILIIGNSHAADTFLLFKLNPELTKDYNFEYSSLTFLSDKILNKNNSDENFSFFLNNFNNSDIILFSNRWSKNDINILQNILAPLLETQKKIIIANQNVILPTIGKRDVTLLDKFIIENKRLPNKKELIFIEKQYFDHMINDTKRNRYNNQLKTLANKYNLKFLDKSLYQCNYNLKRCSVFTNNNNKINYNSHHHTLDGLKHLSIKINEINWFK